MALTFVYGNSGSGKSEYMYRKFADMAERTPYQHYFVVVPEQFTMSAQRSLVEHVSSGVILNIDVVSFERLAYRVFNELGVHRTAMEETGKSLLLRRIVEMRESDLTILRRNLTKMGYIGELKSVLSELMQYGISPDDLEDFLEELDEESSLAGKLRDILQIYRSFDDSLQDGYVTAERVLDLLVDEADRSELLRGAVFFFDGYTGFTPVQLNLIRKLMHLAKDIYVSVTLDAGEPLYAPAEMEDLFYMSHKMVNALVRAARDASYEIAEAVRIEAGLRSRFRDNPVLFHLEQNLFRVPADSCPGSCGDALKVRSLLSARDELRSAAAQIRMLVREKQYRYRDFAIVCSDVQEYEKYADAVFALYDIPGFVDRKQSILYHPLTELVRSVPEMAESDCSAESVFRYLRTGLAGFAADEVDLLENYCMENGIRGIRRWRSEFDRLPARHGRLPFDGERAEAERIAVDGLRQRFADQTEEVLDVFRKKDATVRERTESLYELLCRLGAEERLRAETKRFEREGDELSASVTRQIFKIVIDLFDRMVDLLGDTVLTASDYAEILDAGLEAARVGAIPPGRDCVILGDIERTRLDEIKVLFLVGACDGAIPKKEHRQSILSAHDREVLEAHHLELAPGEREQVFLQRFYLYLALTKPSDALYITYPRMDGEGKAVRPSYLIGVLEKLFPDLRTEETGSHGMLPPVTAKSSVEAYLTGLAATDSEPPDPVFKALHRWYMRDPLWSGRIRKLFDAHFAVFKNSRLDPALARALYGDVLYNSFTRLERFGDCAFAHFLEYGLRLAQRGEFSFRSPDMGTLFHAVLEKFGKRLEETDNWSDVTREREDEILREAIDETVRELYDPSLFETASGAYDLERVYRILSRSVWAITEQIRRGDFLPAGYEVDIGGKDGPDEGETALPAVRIVGRVDRMDVCEDEDKVSVRVFDYKSGKTDLKLQNVYYGRQLQLPVYLDTAMRYLRDTYPDREIVPAGIFYFHLDDPMLADAGEEEEEIRRALLGELKPSGLLNDDPDVICRMDRDLMARGSSDVLPVSLNRDGSLGKKNKNAVPSESFEELISYVRTIMDEAAGQMAEGRIDVNPYRMKDRTGCDYCAFRGICGFDPKIPGYSFRDERPLTDEDARERMREKLRGTEEEEGTGDSDGTGD